MLRLLVPVALALVVAGAGSPARGFCRTVAVRPPAGQDSTAGGCWLGPPDMPKPFLFLRNTCVGYNLQQDGGPGVPLEVAAHLMGTVFAAWAASPCAGGPVTIQAQDLGPVACAQATYNLEGANQNVILFRSDGWPHVDGGNTL